VVVALVEWFYFTAMFRRPLQPGARRAYRGCRLLRVGVTTVEEIWHHQTQQGGFLYLTGLQPPGEALLRRAGLVDAMGADKLCWGADQAITAAACRLAARGASTWHPGATWGTEEDARLDEELPLGVVAVS
jgi:hypothetical protein